MSRVRCRAVHETCQDTDETEVAARDFDTVNVKIFSLLSIKSVVNVELKTKATTTTKLCEYKIDTDSDGNLLPIKEFKALLSNTKIDNLKSQKIKKSSVT